MPPLVSGVRLMELLLYARARHRGQSSLETWEGAPKAAPEELRRIWEQDRDSMLGVF
jgi:hypothetical protein